ncbi:MAG: tape measure protein [Paludibacter sp.]|nr:tape measure protein [Paludibacter sp.]
MNSSAVEYILRARDMLSGVLKNASKAAENASKSVNNVGTSTQKSMSIAQKFVDRTGQSWKKYIENLKESNNKTNELASGIRKVVGAMALFQGVKAVVKLGADLEQSKISFDVLLGSAEKAKVMLDGINKFANATPYENKGLIDNAKMMLSFGTSAEKILPNLKMIGDIAMGDVNKMSSLTLAYSQMSSAGKLQGQDLLQMINAGFNPLNELVKITGKSMGTLRKEMEGGKISAQMVEAAFQHATGQGGMFFGMMDKMSQTASGKFSTLVGTLRQTGAEIGLKLLPYANSLMNFLMPMVDWIGRNSDMLLQLTGVALGAFAAFKLITGAIKLWTIAQAILNGTMLLNPVGLVIAGIAVLIAIIVVAWNKFAWFRGGVMGVWESFKLLVKFIKDVVVGYIKGLISMFTGLGKIIQGVFSRDWGSIKEGAKQAAGGFAESFGGNSLVKAAIDNGSKIGATWAKGYNKGLDSFANPKTRLDASSLTGNLSGSGAEAKNINPLDTSKSIASSGSKPTNISIVLNKEMVGEIKIYPSNMTEGAVDLKNKIVEVLMQVLNSANRMAIE